MTDKEDFTLTAAEVAALRQNFQYCPRCRTEMVDKAVYGRVRRVCPAKTCCFIQFIDPKVSAAVMVEKNKEVLLIQRAMSPAKGSWCLPGGFMEIGETPQQSAIRECKEESGLDIEISRLIDVFYYEDFRGSGVLIMFKGQVIGGQLHAGDDAQQAQFFRSDNLPQNIQFASNIEALTRWQKGEI